MKNTSNKLTARLHTKGKVFPIKISRSREVCISTPQAEVAPKFKPISPNPTPTDPAYYFIIHIEGLPPMYESNGDDFITVDSVDKKYKVPKGVTKDKQILLESSDLHELFRL